MSEESRESLRNRLVSEYPKWHHPVVQLLAPSLVGLCCIGYFASKPNVFQWISIPLSLFFIFIINGIEHSVHRWLFHFNMPGFKWMFQRHAGEHHVIFTHDSMSLRNIDEIRLVMVPIRTLFMLLVSLLVLYYSLSYMHETWGALFIINSLFYVLCYEWMHLFYHLPESMIKNKIIRYLARHHTTHHNKRLMKNYNLNVTLPIWDHILDTKFKE